MVRHSQAPVGQMQTDPVGSRSTSGVAERKKSGQKTMLHAQQARVTTSHSRSGTRYRVGVGQRYLNAKVDDIQAIPQADGDT